MTYTDRAPPTPGMADARHARARRRVAALKGFYLHLLVYVLVIAGLAFINWMTGPPWWVLWTLFGWGIGIVAHGLVVSAFSSRAISNWEERKIRQYMQDER